MSNFKFLISLLLILAFGASSTYIITAEYIEHPTLRDKLSQQVPMVASFEVKGKHHGVYQLENVNGDKEDVGDYTLEGDYEIGDVVTVLFATEDSTEITSDVKVGTASQLDVQWSGGGGSK
ncbi:hypothetical protein [Bacillus toyonensis]|uniref:hypothetical protein n=1 Tax=Bacillus toyonensis TaxID=155322 RepID=UPI000BF3D0A5|nr:hypothetical protein [Bacillus toyonensis]PFY86033.1 hypothetical protein COL62_02225 [Bacillus toyonensis]